MPGLFGIIAKKQGLPGPCLLSMARRMADSMRPVPWLRAEIWGCETFCGGRVHLGVLNPLPQPLITSDELTRVWFDGEFYPTSASSRTTPTAEGVSKLVSGSAASLAEIDGVFALACFNAERRELVLANDRLGFRPLYYTETEDWFAYAAEVKALLAIRDRLPDLDEISLRQFFGFDHMLGERTWWKGIELIPPASVWHISTRGRTSHQYWTFDDIRRDAREPADVQVEFGRLWSQDMQRHSKPGTMPLLLSGGQDSRLLVAELCAQGADLVAITCGSEEAADMELARRVAATAGIRHQPCYLNTDNWWHGREEAIWQTDALISGVHFHFAIARHEMHTGNWYSPLNIAGDSIFGGVHLDKSISTDWPLSLDKLLARWYVENPFFGREEIVSVSIPDARRYTHGPSSACFRLNQRLRRLILYNTSKILAPYCEIAFPGISYALIQLSLGSLSDEDRIDHKFYNHFLVTRHPQYFANIPWQGTGRGLAESLPTRLWKDHIRRRLYRLVGKSTKKAIPSNQWFVNYPQCVRESKIRDRLLRQDLIADEFLGGAAKRALVNFESRPLSAEALIAILTFEIYLRQVAGMPNLAGLVSSSPE